MLDIRKMESAWVKIGESKFGLGSYLDNNIDYQAIDFAS